MTLRIIERPDGYLVLANGKRGVLQVAQEVSFPGPYGETYRTEWRDVPVEEVSDELDQR